MAAPLPTPRRASEVSQAWLELALTTHEAAASPGVTVQVTHFQTHTGSEKDDNLTSEVVKIVVEGRVTPPDGAQPFQRHYDLFAKFPTGNELEQRFTKVDLLDLKELLVYSDVMKDLNAYQEEVTGGKYPLTVPGYVYGTCTDTEWVLVMEDVSTRGYKTREKILGLDLTHALLAVDRLARVHGVSHAFNHTHDFLHKYPAFKPDDGVMNILPVMRAVYEGTLSLAQQQGEDFSPIVEKMIQNRDAIFTILCELISLPGKEKDKLLCLTHGDCWTNNLMFSYGENSEGASPAPEDLVLIDWGLVRWNNPLYDLQYLLHSSTTLDLRKAHLREILDRYHTIFTAVTQDLGTPVPNWGIEDLLKEWRRIAVCGFLVGILVNLMTLSEATKVSFQRGSLSSGWSFRVKTALAKVMVPVMRSPPMAPVMAVMMKKSMEPMIAELLSGKNKLLTTRVLDFLKEALDDGVLDP